MQVDTFKYNGISLAIYETSRGYTINNINFYNNIKELKATYECYQDIISSIAEKDFIKFKNIVEHQNNLVSDKMSKALKLKLYKENIKYIENSFKYDINNGIYSRMKE